MIVLAVALTSGGGGGEASHPGGAARLGHSSPAHGTSPSSAAQTKTSSHSSGSGVYVPARGIYWGASIKNRNGQAPWQMRAVSPLSDRTGKRPSIISWGSPFYSSRYCDGYCAFQTRNFQLVRRYGAIPMFSWSPNWKPQIDRQIADGAYDGYLTRWARQAKAWGHPFFLRFAWEMNGAWFPWSVGGRRGVSSEGNTPATFTAMWIHVWNVFHRVGVRNVTWVWCPNVDARTMYEPLSKLYPGSRYVDWTCLDGYNGNRPWTSFKKLFQPTYEKIVKFIAPGKPMLIGEVASTEAGGSKARWIINMLNALPGSFPDIRGLVWYDVRSPGLAGHRDWPIESSTRSISAFRNGIGSAVYAANIYSRLDRSPIPVP